MLRKSVPHATASGADQCQVVAAGSCAYRHSCGTERVILSVDSGPSALPAALDLGGDLLIPGIVDLHTDNLERQVQPRPNARFPSRAAFLAHDAQCAAAGVTTVFDALCVGDLGYQRGRTDTFADAVRDGTVLAALGALKSEHYLHLRCELPAPDMQSLLADAIEHPALRLVSLMDHTPGHGQHAELAGFIKLRRQEGMEAAAVQALIDTLTQQRADWRGRNRDHILQQFAGRAIPLAGHDERTAAEVGDNFAAGLRISEFPVTRAAAQAARALGMQVIAGAPNVVRGGSHSGNVAVAALLAEQLVDALASDYAPAALIGAGFRQVAEGSALWDAMALITDRPARMAGLSDRGRLAPGLRADLVQVHLVRGMPDLPVIRAVWRAGCRIA